MLSELKPRLLPGCALALAISTGCVSVDQEALDARNAVQAGHPEAAVAWSEKLATDSGYSRNLGMVEAGRIRMLSGDFAAAERWFRQAVDSAIDRKESAPKIKLGDVGNTVLASTLTDDRTREYYLEPYELNLALEYGIIAQVLNGRKDDALADARLACYVQDNLAETYGADVAKSDADKTDDKQRKSADKVYAEQSAAMSDVMAGTRSSWENPVLWWLTGVLFEADGDLNMAGQSYRRANAVRAGNAVFSDAVARATADRRLPAVGKARLVVVYEEGLVPMRTSLKVPVPLYTMMSIDIPKYESNVAYYPTRVSISGAKTDIPAAPALDVRSLAYRDLDERLPGIIARNISRAAVQAGAQTAVNYGGGNSYAKLAVFAANTVVSAIRRADTRSWITLPDGQQVWDDGEMEPGNYRIGVNAGGRMTAVDVNLSANETRLLWIADSGASFQMAQAAL